MTRHPTPARGSAGVLPRPTPSRAHTKSKETFPFLSSREHKRPTATPARGSTPATPARNLNANHTDNNAIHNPEPIAMPTSIRTHPAPVTGRCRP